MDKIGPDGVAKELAEEGFDQAGIDAYMELFRNVTPDLAGIRYLGEKLSGFLDEKIAQDLVTIIESVDAVKTANFRLVFDPTLVRGMSYYTGPIFEISIDGFSGSVGGGGRYDEMIGRFTGTQTCACGFSIGFERIVMLLMEKDFQVPGAGEKIAYLLEKRDFPGENAGGLPGGGERARPGTAGFHEHDEKEQKVPEGTARSGGICPDPGVFPVKYPDNDITIEDRR